MANKPFDQYFSDKTALVGQQGPDGDDFLVLRAGTVFKGNQVYNKAIATMTGNATTTDTTPINTWVPLGGTLIQGVTTPTFTFAANQFTYIGPNQIVATSFKAAASLVGTTTPVESYEIGIFVNDLLILNGMLASASSDGVTFVSTEIQRLLVTGDVIDIRMRNTNAAVSPVIATSVQLIIG